MTSISVVMPSLNSGLYIGEAIQSVLGQEHSELELLIQDGGSADATPDIVRAFDDPRISWMSEPDSGQSDALNRAIRRSSGEWILWLNADDMLSEGALVRIGPFLASAQRGFVHGDFGMIDVNGRIVKRYVCSPVTVERLLRRGAYVFSGSVLVNRALVRAVGDFDPGLHFCMDYDWLLRLAKASEAHYEPGIVAFLREHPESKGRTKPWGFWREHWNVRRRHGAPLPSSAVSQTAMASYLILRPLLRSRLWRRLRPTKRLGGSHRFGPSTASWLTRK
jgi:glycosyltransferase involved in cell wall biosynthesis